MEVREEEVGIASDLEGCKVSARGTRVDKGHDSTRIVAPSGRMKRNPR